jgi:predicted phosphodiesterase
MEQALSLQIRRPSAVLFLGDGLRDFEDLTDRHPELLTCAVAGNCDASLIFPPDEPPVRTLVLGGVTIVMMHGHTHDVRYGLGSAIRYAAEREADVLLFGHTHLPYERTLAAGTEVEGGRSYGPLVLKKSLTVANPGSIGQPRDGNGPCFGVLTVQGGTVLFSHGHLS